MSSSLTARPETTPPAPLPAPGPPILRRPAAGRAALPPAGAALERGRIARRSTPALENLAPGEPKEIGLIRKGQLHVLAIVRKPPAGSESPVLVLGIQVGDEEGKTRLEVPSSARLAASEGVEAGPLLVKWAVVACGLRPPTVVPDPREGVLLWRPLGVEGTW